jgi:NitT/TauT family transport system permease protein
MSLTIKVPVWLKFIPLATFLIFWEIAATSIERGVFFFGSPSTVARFLWIKTIDGSLPFDMGVTLYETIAGFIIGNIVGSITGMSLWYFPRLSQVSRPYIIAFGSIPIFALSPIIIIWFGIGLKSKIILAAMSTVVVSIVQAYEGAIQTDQKLIDLILSMGASKFVAFKKVVVPSTMSWLLAGYKINVGFALLGAFIGEFISSEAGLGHMIIQAMGLFNIPLVLTGVVGICILSLILVKCVGILQLWLMPWQKKLEILNEG